MLFCILVWLIIYWYGVVYIMIIKLSSSGKQVQVVDDDGCVFGTSVTFLKGLLEGKAPRGFVLLTRLPFKVASSRFMKSPTWNPSTGEKEVDVKLEDDPYAVAGSYREVKERKDSKPIEDVREW